MSSPILGSSLVEVTTFVLKGQTLGLILNEGHSLAIEISLNGDKLCARYCYYCRLRTATTTNAFDKTKVHLNLACMAMRP